MEVDEEEEELEAEVERGACAGVLKGIVLIMVFIIFNIIFMFLFYVVVFNISRGISCAAILRCWKIYIYILLKVHNMKFYLSKCAYCIFHHWSYRCPSLFFCIEFFVFNSRSQCRLLKFSFVFTWVPTKLLISFINSSSLYFENNNIKEY